jgi:hypothetical protein
MLCDSCLRLFHCGILTRDQKEINCGICRDWLPRVASIICDRVVTSDSLRGWLVPHYCIFLSNSAIISISLKVIKDMEKIHLKIGGRRRRPYD